MVSLRRLSLAFTTIAITACSAATVPPSEHPLMEEGIEARKEATLAGEFVAMPAKGKVTVVDFWSTSCEHCKDLMPEIEAIYENGESAGVRVVGVAVDDNPGLVQKRLKERGITYPNVLDPESVIEGAYRVTDLPQTFVFDKKGSLRFFARGAKGESIRQAVDALLAEP